VNNSVFISLNTLLGAIGLWLVSVVFSTSLLANQVDLHQFTATNVLGTSFEMFIKAPKEQASQAEEAVLAEIKRLEKIFSSYDSNSEISQLNQQGHINNGKISKDLLAVIHLCESWQQKLPKSFSCRLGNVITLWQSFETEQQRPNRVDIRATARQAQQSQYTGKDLLAAKRNDDFTWNLGGIAKGYILDQAMKIALATATKASAIKIDIGGDGVYWQHSNNNTPNWLVGLARPNNIDDSQEHRLGTYAITTGALAYSGHQSRARHIGRRSYSHILSPRDGWPTHNPVTAIVKAEDAASADALATALAATEISIALDWLQKHPQYAALLIDSDGRHYASNNWYQHFHQSSSQATKSDHAYQAEISFSLPKINSAEYRKPYVALWVANQQGKVVKNLLILGQSERWMQENRSWWRVQGRKAPSLLDGFARPTRRPGEYRISWNGRNDFGQKLPTGQYKLLAEVAREHGRHEKIVIPFKLDERPLSLSKKGTEEIGLLTLKSSPTNRILSLKNNLAL